MTDLFDIRVWLYPGANPSADPSLWGNEVDVSAYVRQPGNDGGQPITYSAGKGEEAASVDAGNMRLSLNNRDGRFSTDKIDGPYYGLLDLNTPARMGTVAFRDAFTRTTSNGFGTPDVGTSYTVPGTVSNFSTDGSRAQVKIASGNTGAIIPAVDSNCVDGDVTLSIVPSATATGAAYGAGIIMRYTNTSNLVVGTLEFNTAGTLTVKIRQNLLGVTNEIGSLNPIPSSAYSAGQVWKLRMQADGNQIRLKHWLASGSEPSTWTLTATESDLLGSTCGVYVARFNGNTNSGVANLVGLDDYLVIGFEVTGLVVSWPLRWDITGNNSWVPITVAGVLRRLQQGTNPVQSPLRRQLAATADVCGYWPMEDGDEATYFTSAIPKQQPARFNASGVTPASENTLAGGGAAPTLGTNGQISAMVAKGNAGTGMAGMFLFKLPSMPGSKTRICRFRCSRGPVPIWDLSIDATSIYTEGLSADGSVVTSSTSALPSVDFTSWVAWQLETDNTLSPGNTSWSSITHQVGLTDYWAQTGSISGATNTVILSAVLTGASGTSFGHLWLGANTLPFVTDTFSLISSGYSGELASARFARVATEAGIPYIVRPGTSEAMGPQREGTTMAILRSCVDADYGVLAERGAGLEMIPRSARWNSAVVMAITKAAGEIADVPEPVRDDQRLRNRWTVGRTSGGTGTAQDDDSVERNGTWEDSASINVRDETVLDNHAAWRVAIGVVKTLRWPKVSLNFGRNRALLPKWRAKGYGWRLTISTLLTQVTGNEPDLIVEGFVASLHPNGWTVDLNASSASVWRAAVADDTGIYGRVDTDGCTTTALISSTATSIPVTTVTGFPKWDNTAGLWSGGVDLYVGGERVTVTSISNGAGQAQTFTATARGVNGYAASHASGTEVRLWDPPVAAL